MSVDDALISLVSFMRAGLWCCETRLGPPVKIFLLTAPGRYFICGSFLLFVFVMLSCLFIAACGRLLEVRADLLALSYVWCFLVFLSLSHVVPVLGHLCYVIVLIPDLCLLTDFES